MSMVPESRRLLDALVATYSGFVRSRLPATPEGIDEALAEGEVWLRSALTDLLTLPFPDQRRGPLEVFQEAMKFPTEILREAGVETPRRDPPAEAALPGDSYDLAPVSSRDLGEEIWTIHLTWGATKARAMTS